MTTHIFIFLSVITAIFAGTSAKADGVFETLAENCGKAFIGEVVKGPADDPWRSAELVMHVRDCSVNEIRVPLHYDDNRSRVWRITRTSTGMQLKHDHRHEDGTPDAVSMYGGKSETGDGLRGDASVAFVVDEESLKIFRDSGSNRSTENVWSMSVDDNVFYYGLVQPDLDFMVAFDLSTPVDTPPPAWDQ